MGELLQNLIRRAAEASPDKIAFTDGKTSISYGELESKSNQLANLLVEQGMKIGDRAAVFMPRCAQTAVAFYGILKSGGIVVPVDPGMPAGGVRSLIRNCGIRFMLTNPKKARIVRQVLAMPESIECAVGVGDLQCCASDVKLLPWSSIDAASNRWGNQNSDRIKPNDSAYIMYSSGSTGRPKGITHTHASGLAYAKLSVATYDVTSDDVIANHSPINFDMSTFGYFSSCYAGATTLIIPAAHSKAPVSLAKLAADHKVTIWYSVPLALQQMLQHAPLDELDFSSMRWVLYGGEPFPPKHLRALMKKWPHARVSNVYGPAEVNQCTYYHVPAQYAADYRNLPVPIGRTWDQADGLIIDAEDEIIDDQRSGELVICSPTMMLGYWGRPELNKKALFHHVDPSGSPKVYYRTGDLVKRREDGNLMFLGRKDRQVKVRGYRVELDDIERTLSNHPDVEEAGVYWILNGSEKEIQATIICDENSKADEISLKNYLKSCLSAYAIPNRITLVSDLPRTGSGKIDRKYLKDSAQTSFTDFPRGAK